MDPGGHAPHPTVPSRPARKGFLWEGLTGRAEGETWGEGGRGTGWEQPVQLLEEDRVHLWGCQEGARASRATAPLKLGCCPVLSSKPEKASPTDVTNTELSVMPAGPHAQQGPVS